MSHDPTITQQHAALAADLAHLRRETRRLTVLVNRLETAITQNAKAAA